MENNNGSCNNPVWLEIDTYTRDDIFSVYPNVEALKIKGDLHFLLEPYEYQVLENRRILWEKIPESVNTIWFDTLPFQNQLLNLPKHINCISCEEVKVLYNGFQIDLPAFVNFSPNLQEFIENCRQTVKKSILTFTFSDGCNLLKDEVTFENICRIDTSGFDYNLYLRAFLNLKVKKSK